MNKGKKPVDWPSPLYQTYTPTVIYINLKVDVIDVGK